MAGFTTQNVLTAITEKDHSHQIPERMESGTAPTMTGRWHSRKPGPSVILICERVKFAAHNFKPTHYRMML